MRVVIKCDLILNYWLSQTIQFYLFIFFNQSFETRDKPPYDVTLKRRFISDKQPSVIPVCPSRNVIALRLFELLIFWNVRKARDLFFNMHNTVE